MVKADFAKYKQCCTVCQTLMFVFWEVHMRIGYFISLMNVTSTLWQNKLTDCLRLIIVLLQELDQFQPNQFLNYGKYFYMIRPTAL